MTTTAASTTVAEPMMKGSTFLGLNEALRTLYGDAAAEEVTRRLPPDVAEATQPGKIYARTWVPERFVTEIAKATFDGPAKRDLAEFGRWVHAANEQGFGKVQRLLLRLSSPGRILSLAAGLWRDGHTHGTVETKVEGRSASVELKDFPPLENELMRHAYCATLRALIHMTGAVNPRARHAMSGPTSIVITLEWD